MNIGTAPARRSSYQLLRLVEEKGDLGTWVWDVATGAVEWSPGLYRIAGVDPSRQRASFDLYQSLIHPDDRLDLSAGMDLSDHSTIFDRDFRLIRPDGAVRWLRGFGEVVHDADGRIRQAAGVVFDITSQKSVSTSLHRASCSLEELARALGGAIWIKEADGTVADIFGWQELTGQSLAGVQNSGWRDAIHPQDRERIGRLWQDALKSGTGYVATCRIHTASAGQVPMTITVRPVRERESAFLRFVGICLPATRPADGGPGDRGTAPALSPRQIRAARAVLGWSVEDLATRSGVSGSTIRRHEGGGTGRPVGAALLDCLRETFEAEGITFGTEDGRASVAFADGGAERADD